MFQNEKNEYQVHVILDLSMSESCIEHEECEARFIPTAKQLDCMEPCGCQYWTCDQGLVFLRPDEDCPEHGFKDDRVESKEGDAKSKYDLESQTLQ
ncbi:MAG: hypothetical protein K0U52_05870 [Gammaproteobacteria bacterium]|nr:hypothetical protein [Gammaproteobacteria bacterium]